MAIRFTNSQRNRLRLHCALSDDQINSLQSELQFIQTMVHPQPTLSDVLVGLEELRDSLSNYLKQARRLERAQDHSALAESRERLIAASVSRGISTETLHDSIFVMQPILSATEQAIKDLPREQRRRDSANPTTVARIASALGLDPAIRGRRGAALFVSASQESRFYRIVCICYEAVGHDESSPDRAIRKLLKESRT